VCLWGSSIDTIFQHKEQSHIDNRLFSQTIILTSKMLDLTGGMCIIKVAVVAETEMLISGKL
jgi:hypothetical protein